MYDENMQEQARQADVDIIEEKRRRAGFRNANYHQQLRRYHQRFVRDKQLQEGDLVLRRVMNREGLHKLSPMLMSSHFHSGMLKGRSRPADFK
jgi:hypothetical protein